MYKGHNLTMGGGLAREGSPGKDLEAKLWGPGDTLRDSLKNFPNQGMC